MVLYNNKINFLINKKWTTRRQYWLRTVTTHILNQWLIRLH
jgi:hypothetical protein